MSRGSILKHPISRKTTILVVVFLGVLIGGFSIGSLMQKQARLVGFAQQVPESLEFVSKAEVAPRIESAELEVVGRMVIYKANLQLEIDDIDSTAERIRYIADEFGGFVSEVSVSGRETKVGRITIRVPEESFHDAVARIEELGKVTEKRVESADVTERYIDLKARLETREREEKRLLEILDKARTVEEVLTVERELWRIREEIERLKGQMLYLERMVKLATINVLLEEEAPKPWVEVPEVNWGAPIELGLWCVALIVQGLIAIAIAAIPVAVIGTPAYGFYRRRKAHRDQTG